MINWIYFPKNTHIVPNLERIVNVFQAVNDHIDSHNHTLESNAVLHILENKLIDIGFNVELSKKKDDIIKVPVLFGLQGKSELAFEADAYCQETKTVIEVEAGRGVTNYQFLKDFYQACMMVDVDYLCIAVRNIYRKNKDFEKVCSFFDALFLSGRLIIPLKGILVIGY